MDFAARTFGVGNIQWAFATKLSIYLLVFFSILTNFVRPDFLNLLIGVMALYYFYTQPNISFYYKILVFGILISEVYDLIWIWIYLANWVEGTNSLEDNIRRLSAAMSIVNFISKLLFGAIFWKNSIELS